MTCVMVSCHKPNDCTVKVTATSPTPTPQVLSDPRPSLDKKVFLPTFILVMIIGALLVLKPESAQLLLGDALQVVTFFSGGPGERAMLFRLVLSTALPAPENSGLWRNRGACLAGVQSLRAGKIRRP